MIEIKKATVKDADVIMNLNESLFHNDFKFDDTLDVEWPKKNKKFYSNRIKDKNSLTLIAYINKEVVGYLAGNIFKAEEWRNVKKVAEAQDMLVIEKYRGQGIGSQLIQNFIKWARENKAERIRVTASAANKNAIKVYMKNGFMEYNNVMELAP